MIGNIKHRWRVLSGQHNWENLLKPLDSDLQQYILHYGAMAQSTYDTFNSNKLSRYAGSSLYTRRDLFSKVGLVYANPYKYKAVKFLYATSRIGVPEGFICKSLREDSWCKKSNWIGYVAVATDEGKAALGRRDILVAWRGTSEPIEWVKDFEFPLVSASKILGGDAGDAQVHQGFLSVYTSDDQESVFNKTSARDQVLSEVKAQVEKHKDEEISITITGHSLGGALATLNAVDIVANGHHKPENQPNKPCLVTAFEFASPRVGESKFKSILQSLHDLRILSVRNALDIVPRLPPLGYADVGTQLQVDSRKSRFLKRLGDVLSWHNLEAGYLHSLAIEGGDKQVRRDVALVNKSTGALKDEYLIPTLWWSERNKGMVQNKDGSWQLHDHERDDDDPN